MAQERDYFKKAKQEFDKMDCSCLTTEEINDNFKGCFYSCLLYLRVFGAGSNVIKEIKNPENILRYDLQQFLNLYDLLELNFFQEKSLEKSVVLNHQTNQQPNQTANA